MRSKSYYKFVLFISMFLIFIPSIYAEDLDEKICNYVAYFKGDLNSEYKVNISVKQTLISTLGIKSVKVELIDGSSQFEGTFEAANGEKVNVKIDIDPFVDTDDWLYDGDKLTDCYDFFYEFDNTDKLTIYNTSNDGGTEQTRPTLQSADSNGDIVTGDTEKNNTIKKTTCTVQVAASDTISGEEVNSNLKNRMISLTFDSYEDGSVYVTCGDCSTLSSGGYLKKSETSDVALTFKRNTTDVFHFQEIKIYNDDVDSLLAKFPYGLSEKDCPEELTINTYDKTNDIAVSVDKRDDASGSTVASSSKTFDGDLLPSTPAIDTSTNATCTDILSEKVIGFIQAAWNIVKAATVVVTILFGILDFLGSTSKDKDALMEAVNKTIKRIIILLIILLLPTIIDIFGDLIDKPDLMCGIR